MKRLIGALLLLAALGGCVPFLVSKYMVDEHASELHDVGVTDAGP